MKKHVISVLLLLVMQPAFARGMSAQEAVCLGQIKDETDFIISRINIIHKGYEEQVKQSEFGKYQSGDYSTVALLDNTIRKYRRKLVRKYKKYPFRYEADIKSSQRTASKHCLIEQLRIESVGSLHDFELSWQRAIELAKKNAGYFKQVDTLESPVSGTSGKPRE